MSSVKLEAELREDQGKGASRRLRRLEAKVPAVIYGGEKAAQSIHLLHKTVVKALETESIYSSVFDLHLSGKVERVILKDLQRHPYKPVILHMDFQRVAAKDVLVKMIPLHFINVEECKGVKEGGMVNHTMTQVEVRCQAQYLPQFIEVDLADMEIDDVIHLSDLKLAKGVHLATDPTVGGHDHPVVSVHLSKVADVDEEETIEEESEDEVSEVVNEETTATDASEEATEE